MKMIFEHVDGIDYLELILTAKEIGKLEKNGVVKIQPTSLFNRVKLNLYVRKQQANEAMEEEDAIEKGIEQESDFGEYPRNDGVRVSPKASSRSKPLHSTKIKTARA